MAGEKHFGGKTLNSFHYLGLQWEFQDQESTCRESFL